MDGLRRAKALKLMESIRNLLTKYNEKDQEIVRTFSEKKAALEEEQRQHQTGLAGLDLTQEEIIILKKLLKRFGSNSTPARARLV